VQSLAAYTRAAPRWQEGLSPRACLALLAVARAWACSMAATMYCLKTSKLSFTVSSRIA